jgi:exopolysaccharide biosynthesis polyprenyl glycosylphosphotransferase
VRRRDSNDALASVLAVLGDAAAVWLGMMAAVWIRFDSGLMPVFLGRVPNLYANYALFALLSLPIYLVVFQVLKLYSRPQTGNFTNRAPRILRACSFGTLGVLVFASLIKNRFPVSNATILVSFATVTLLVLLERLLLFRFEFALARRAEPIHRTLLLGAGDVAVKLLAAAEGDPRIRTRVVGVLAFEGESPDAALPQELLLGTFADLDTTVQDHDVDQIVLTGNALSHDQTAALFLFCERRMIAFTMVPDFFRLLTSSLDIHIVSGIPVLGARPWPLDNVWNRIAKRTVDILGSFVGLVLSAPVMAVAAWAVQRESPGPVFYRQERAGRNGKPFFLYKIRTMRPDAEASGGKPGWTVPDDPRRTRSGAFLRKYNLDELPQFWNVLKGDMSLVGPRPERPYFIEHFKTDIEHYMARHSSKPGITGWAQVNGLRGDTSIEDRVRYDIYYLRNWSLAFDLKVLVRTFFTNTNAY